MIGLQELSDDLLSLFFPRICVCCGSVISQSERYICICCTSKLSFAKFSSFTDNDLLQLMAGRCDIKYACTLFYSRKQCLIQNLLAQLKYKNRPYLGELFGEWLGENISESPMKEVDIVIPIPLHNTRKRKRGYNQSAKFAQKLATYLKALYCENNLIKPTATLSQVGKSKWERWTPSQNVFKLKDKTYFQGKHILIVDDLITTGNTIQNCISVFEEIPNINISIATIAMVK